MQSNQSASTHEDRCIMYDVIFMYKSRLMKFAIYAPDEEVAQEMGELQVQEVIRESAYALLGAQTAGMVRKELEETNVIEFQACNVSQGY